VAWTPSSRMGMSPAEVGQSEPSDDPPAEEPSEPVDGESGGDG
jgi:hypothetical protein